MASSTLSAKYKASSGLSAKYAASSTLAVTHDAPMPVVTEGTLVSEVTLTRADSATYFDSNGLLQTAAADEPRTTYIGGEPLLWLDGEVTEISGRSADLDNWPIVTTASVAQDAVGLDGQSNTAFTLTDSSDAEAQRRQVNTGITDSAGDVYYQVCAIKEGDDSVYPVASVENAAGGTRIDQGIAINRNTGAYTETASDGIVVLEPIKFGSFWLFVQSVTANGTGNAVAAMRAYPAYNTDGGTALDVSAQGSTVFGYCGLFKDNFSLMPVLTTGGTTKTVAADVASLANSVIAGLTEGTLYMEVWTPQLTSNAARHIAELQSDASNFIRVFHDTDGDLDAQITSGGVSQATLAGTDLTVGQLQKVALAFDGSDYALYRDGTQLATASSGTMPSVDTLLIGAGLYGGIRNMNVYTVRKSNAELVTLTT